MDRPEQSATKLAAVAVVLAVLPAAMANAQSWSELETLTFDPVGFERIVSNPANHNAVAEQATIDQARDEPAAELIIARIRAALDELESAADAFGENSPRLLPMLSELAAIYREIGEPADAVAALERSQQIIRQTQGLHSLDQAELIEQVIEIEMSIAQPLRSSEKETELRELVLRNPGDRRNVAILTNMATRQMEVARYLLINGIEPEFQFNLNLAAEWGRRRAAPPTARSMAASLLRQARSNYGLAMREALSDEPVNIPELLVLEQSIVDVYYFELMNSGLRRGSQPFGSSGRLRFGGVNALNAKLDNSEHYPGTPEAYSAALIELADWHLMFGSFGRAMDTYDEARSYLASQDGGDPMIAAMLSPDMPVPLPAFVANQSVYSGLGDIEGYVDVEVKINRFGGVRDVDIVDTSANASDSVVRRLKRHVYQTRFRPRFVDGEWLPSDRFTMRFEFGYSSS